MTKPQHRADAMDFTVRRAYDAPRPEDGERVLVDRMWPRGVSKERAEVALWLKDVTPSKELRSWYHEDPEQRFDAFADRYRAELAQPAGTAALDELLELRHRGPVTLVTAVKDVAHSHVPVLLDRLAGLSLE